MVLIVNTCTFVPTTNVIRQPNVYYILKLKVVMQFTKIVGCSKCVGHDLGDINVLSDYSIFYEQYRI